jgi:hypothetical protein
MTSRDWKYWLHFGHVGAQRTTEIQRELCLALAQARKTAPTRQDRRVLDEVIDRWRKPRLVAPKHYYLELYGDEYETVSRAVRGWGEGFTITPMYQRLRKYIGYGAESRR